MRGSDTVLLSLSAADAVAAMARGDITAEAYATALLKRCEDCRALNAFIALDLQTRRRPEVLVQRA